jgi:hypothetical protein
MHSKFNEEINELVEILEDYEQSAPSAIELEKMTQAINELNDLLPTLTNEAEKARVANIKKTYCRIALEKMGKSDKSDDKLLVLYIRLFINHLKPEFLEVQKNQSLLLKGWNDYLDQWQYFAEIVDKAINHEDFRIGEYRELN